MAPSNTGPRRPREVTFVEALGKGGFGAVYLADVRGEDNFVQRIAVKVLNENLRGESDIVGRQRDEARILAQLNHDHIVKVFDLSEIHGRPAVFMEYVAGVDAGRLLKEGRLPARAALEVAAAVASALDAAWSTPSPMTGRALHVVHRDIKPSNILISAHGGIKVLDFGIARADMDREGQTRTHQYGTARYMAPEQWLGGTIGPSLDIYSLGITLVELMSGSWAERLPLTAERFDGARAQLIYGVRDPKWGAVWWREFSALLSAMLSLSPDDRPLAKDVESTLLDLSEQVGGESLGRLARRRVPELMRQRRDRRLEAPLVSATDTWHHTAPEPSILTGSKSLPTPPKAGASADLKQMLQWAAVACGFVVALAWMAWGWLGPVSSPPSPSPQPVPPMAVPAAVSAEAEPRAEVRKERRRSVREEGPVIVVQLDSVPAGARVTVGGKRVGTTPIGALELSVGRHQVQMKAGQQRGRRHIDVRAGGPTRHTWHQAEDQWSSSY